MGLFCGNRGPAAVSKMMDMHDETEESVMKVIELCRKGNAENRSFREEKRQPFR